jgi:hypothetical protein
MKHVTCGSDGSNMKAVRQLNYVSNSTRSFLILHNVSLYITANNTCPRFWKRQIFAEG